MKFRMPKISFDAAASMKCASLVLVAGLMALFPDTAMAQADPFANASAGAETFRQSLTTFALAVGGIGMVSCLLLGFFGKLNWKWVATGVGVSFGLAVIPGAINWLSTLAVG
ncbi:TrbC/VirB2 family protein [Erythrobacter aureus]|uniref:TrbC/VirB2 family protein n=1 Tax=Erythrobacter aureus TaxID=2182384 RepID=A0A345YIN2_9SPHN|nr:TrbC/VirB2 family protein [Erythrobacter aureus]AXK43784.1 hypothetical protein DVR09_15115 [Erythrobacter aureus]